LNKIIETSDGSFTIYVPELEEHYHSIHGAIQESEHIFLRNGFDTCNCDPISIFEVGFGTGLNAFLTAIRSYETKRHVDYYAIEKYPVDSSLYKLLNYHKFRDIAGFDLFGRLHSAPWNTKVEIFPGFNLNKIKADLTTFNQTGEYDLIYFDAFGPDKQPEMWTEEIFDRVTSSIKDEGIFVTYSAKGKVKRSLKRNGFNVELLQGPPGKRQIIRAVKKMN